MKLHYLIYHGPTGNSPRGWFATLEEGGRYYHSRGMNEINATGFNTMEEAIADARRQLPVSEGGSMDTAPKDGTRVLLRYWPQHYYVGSIQRNPEGDFYQNSGWGRTPEPKWAEARWVFDVIHQGRWEEWSGSNKSYTIPAIAEEDCIEWRPLP